MVPDHHRQVMASEPVAHQPAYEIGDRLVVLQMPKGQSVVRGGPLRLGGS